MRPEALRLIEPVEEYASVPDTINTEVAIRKCRFTGLRAEQAMEVIIV